jgi:hypothetical protein
LPTPEGPTSSIDDGGGTPSTSLAEPGKTSSFKGS